LGQPLDAEALAAPQALPFEIGREHAKAITLRHRPGEVARAAACFEHAMEAARRGDRIEQAEQDPAHAPAPPEIVLGSRDVGELRRIHHAAR
jgi:hypothetical protein